MPRGAVALALALLFSAPPRLASAAPITMRFPEGPAHGFVELSDTSGKALAHGELIQWTEKRTIVSRLVFHFDDGSLYDEVVSFTQHPVFRVSSYHLIQKGPSFTETSEVRFDRSGRYTAHVATAGEEPETDSGTTEVPEDVSNGMTSTLLKNLAPGASATTHMLVFSPKPRLLEVHITPEGSDRYWLGHTDGSATRYRVQPRVTGLTGAVASAVGKQPPPLRFWIASGKAPVMVRFEGVLYSDGPEWRVELAAPRWRD